MTSCLNHPHIQEVFSRSNVPSSAWPYQAKQLDAMLKQEDIHQAHVLEVSLVEEYRKPDASSLDSDTSLLILFTIGCMLLRERGLLTKKTQMREFLYKDARGASFVATQTTHWSGQGDFAIEAVAGGRAVFRLGWSWGTGGSDLARAEAECSRILALMQTGLRRNMA